MKRDGIIVNHKRIARIMGSKGLYSKGSRKKYRYHRKESIFAIKENLLAGRKAQGPNEIWVGDITIIPTQEGYLKLALFLDIFSRKIVGWSMDTRMKDKLVVEALLQAVGRENPSAGMIVHTDQGSQYTSSRFMALVSQLGFVQSMSRRGNPYDNATMESFNKTLKQELVYGANFPSIADAKREVFQYIEMFYNRKRIHSALSYLSPLEFLQVTKNPKLDV